MISPSSFPFSSTMSRYTKYIVMLKLSQRKKSGEGQGIPTKKKRMWFTVLFHYPTPHPRAHCVLIRASTIPSHVPVLRTDKLLFEFHCKISFHRLLGSPKCIFPFRSPLPNAAGPLLCPRALHHRENLLDAECLPC